MKEYLRWYDKDKYLSAFMVLLQSLPPEVQSEVANDMLINIPKIIEKDFDGFINIMSEYNPRSYKRWYDANPELHSAVEAMQNMTKSQREDLIYSISDIIFAHTSDNNSAKAQLEELEVKNNSEDDDQ